MQVWTDNVNAILRKYIRNVSAPVVATTTLSELDIDDLDFQMIVLDIEDAMAVQILHDEAFADDLTVGGLVALVVAHLEAKASRPKHRLPRQGKMRNWMSTGAEG